MPDDRWPGMYRVVRPDAGSLSEMVNLTRTGDAARQYRVIRK